MLKACPYCGRIHDTRFDCGQRPARRKSGGRVDAFRGSNAWKIKRDAIRSRDLNLCRSQTLYHGCAHNKGRLSAWGTSLSKIAYPASTQTEEKEKRMCELLRAGGVDGTGGRTCTSILRFWRPLLCVKLRLQKSAGLYRLSAVIKNRRIRYGRNRHRGLPNSRQHKSRKAVSRSLRLLTLLLYHGF